MKHRTRFAALALAGALLLHPLAADSASAQAGHNAANQLATGFGCYLINPVYGAFKLATAFTGLFVGSLTWVFTGGDVATARKVWNPTMKGTYVISPEHLRGQRSIDFLGPQ